MSLILDALNRSQRDNAPVPELSAAHYTEQSQRKWRQFVPWSGLLVALLVIAALVLEREKPAPVAMLKLGQGSVAEPVATPPAPTSDDKTSAGRVMSPPSSRQTRLSETPEVSPVAPAIVAQPLATPTGVDPAVTQLYQQQLKQPTKPLATTGVAAQEIRPIEPKVKPNVEAESATSVLREQPVDVEKWVLQARAEMENAQLAEHPTPFLAELSQQTKDTIPTIYYQRHEFRGDAADSTVVLNGKPLKEGGAPVTGMRVKEILPDSVVLIYRGTEFRLRALNSWINL